MNKKNFDLNEIQQIMMSYHKNKIFNDEKFIKKKDLIKGSYGDISLYEKDNFEYILKKPSGKTEEDFKAAKADSIISTFLSAYQSKYLNDGYQISPKIYSIKREKVLDRKMSNLIMEKFDGDIFDIFKRLDVTKDQAKNLLIEMLKQISNQLILLQENFKFMHNDLKTNNILYKKINPKKPLTNKNAIFVLSDFGGSSIEINKKFITGCVRGNDLYFNKSKDLYLLIHILITFYDSDLRKNLINFLSNFFTSLNFRYIDTNNDLWHKLYELKEYPKEFEPKIFLEKLEDYLSIPVLE